MPKLPENIDQLDSFYKEQFENFSPEVSDAVWESVSKNIGQSSGFSISTSYLLKVAGVLLGSLALVTVLVKSSETTEVPVIEETQPITVEEILPAEETTVKERVIEIKNPPIVEETTTTTTQNTQPINSSPGVASNGTEKDTTQQNTDEPNEATDFQFVEELELE